MKKKIYLPYDPSHPSRREFLKDTGTTALGIAFWISAGFGCHGDPREGGTDADLDGSSARLVGPGEVPAGSLAGWDLVYTAGREGLPTGARLAMVVEHGADWGEATQFSRNKFGGVRVRCDAGVGLRLHRGLVTCGNGLELVVERGALPTGGQVCVSIGHPDEEGGRLRAPSVAHEATIRILHNLHGEGDERGFFLYEEVLPTPTIRVLPLETVRVDAIAKSKALAGQPVPLLLRAEDRHGNITPDFEGRFEAFDDESDAGLGEIVMTGADQGCVLARDIRFDRTGVRRVRIEERRRGWTAWSDPIEVTDDPGHEGVLWGQMHGHSLVSDGLGTARDYYDYARTRSNLDFCALTDHGYLTERVLNDIFLRHYIDEPTWTEYAAVTREKNDPESFVTFLAYEWTSSIFSDKNVYFLHDDEPWEPYPGTLRQFYDRYRGRPVTIISHMMYAIPFLRATNWNVFDSSLERVVEVASVHGVREFPYNPYFPEDTWVRQFGALMAGHLVIDALRKGHRLGLVCCADTHTGCPGNSISGIQPCRIDGLMALRSSELTREAVWDRWMDRRVYGTTGPRILLDVFLAGMPMGSEVKASEAEAREFDVSVFGKIGVERVELVREAPNFPVDTVELAPPVWNPGTITLRDPSPPEGETFYYVRVHQEDGHMAWSSPFWIVL